MDKLKDYTGTVYGGLAQLLHDYCQLHLLVLPPALTEVLDQERFAFKTWRECLDEIQHQKQHPALGLDIALLIQPKHLGILAYIAQASETLGEALARYYDFHRLIYDGSPLKLEQNEELLSIYWDRIPTTLTTQITDEIAIAIIVKFIKLYIAEEFIHLHQISFKHASPKNMRIYEDYFGCKIQFSQPKTELIFSHFSLNTPIRAADHTLQQLLLNQAIQQLQCLPKSTQLDERLQQAIFMGLQKNNFQIESIAQQLNLSVRGLQRHLQSQQSSYQKRLQEIRLVLATRYLLDPHLSLHEIALLLGYSEQSAFQRAFKNWTKLTPQHWRQSNLSK